MVKSNSILRIGKKLRRYLQLIKQTCMLDFVRNNISMICCLQLRKQELKP